MERDHSITEKLILTADPNHLGSRRLWFSSLNLQIYDQLIVPAGVALPGPCLIYSIDFLLIKFTGKDFGIRWGLFSAAPKNIDDFDYGKPLIPGLYHNGVSPMPLFCDVGFGFYAQNLKLGANFKGLELYFDISCSEDGAASACLSFVYTDLSYIPGDSFTDAAAK